MKRIEFDSEGITSCPKNETATREECVGCKYSKMEHYCFGSIECIYEDVFPEPVEAKCQQ